MSLGLYVDVLNVSMRFRCHYLSLSIYIYMNMFENIFEDFKESLEMSEMPKTYFCYFEFKLWTDMLSIK